MVTSHGENRVTFNVSGDIFETRRTTLNRFPETLLGNEYRMLNFYCNSSKLYFINRNRKAFEAILFFYQSGGDLRLPVDLKMEIFIHECYFYGIPRESIDSMQLKAGVLPQTIARRRKEANKSIFTSGQKKRTFSNRIWDFVENPETSKPAKCFAIFSFFHIFLSVLLACMETSFKNMTTDFWENPFTVGELYLNTWFLLEFLFRLTFCPDFIKFMKTLLNLIDILAVLPYFLLFSFGEQGKKSPATGVLRLLRFVRVLRLFRLSKHSTRIKEVGDILQDSLQDLYIFVLCLFIMTVFSGAILYFAESKHPQTQFTSIPQSMWWALQTVVTLGYGDIVPITAIGKTYSAFFMVFGALTIALPVLSIVMKFTHMYSMNPTEEDQTSTNNSFRNSSIRTGDMTSTSIKNKSVRNSSVRTRNGSLRFTHIYN